MLIGNVFKCLMESHAVIFCHLEVDAVAFTVHWSQVMPLPIFSLIAWHQQMLGRHLLNLDCDMVRTALL